VSDLELVCDTPGFVLVCVQGAVQGLEADRDVDVVPQLLGVLSVVERKQSLTVDLRLVRRGIIRSLVDN